MEAVKVFLFIILPFTKSVNAVKRYLPLATTLDMQHFVFAEVPAIQRLDCASKCKDTADCKAWGFESGKCQLAKGDVMSEHAHGVATSVVPQHFWSTNEGRLVIFIFQCMRAFSTHPK